MSYMNRMFAAASVAAVNSLSDQGQKIKSSFKPALNCKFRFFCCGGDAADLRPLGGFLGCLRGGDCGKEESLQRVMYLNCWGQG